MRVDQAKRLKEMERENARLNKLLAEAELDEAILRGAASGNCFAGGEVLNAEPGEAVVAVEHARDAYG